MHAVVVGTSTDAHLSLLLLLHSSVTHPTVYSTTSSSPSHTHYRVLVVCLRCFYGCRVHTAAIGGSLTEDNDSFQLIVLPPSWLPVCLLVCLPACLPRLAGCCPSVLPFQVYTPQNLRGRLVSISLVASTHTLVRRLLHTFEESAEHGRAT